MIVRFSSNPKLYFGVQQQTPLLPVRQKQASSTSAPSVQFGSSKKTRPISIAGFLLAFSTLWAAGCSTDNKEEPAPVTTTTSTTEPENKILIAPEFNIDQMPDGFDIRSVLRFTYYEPDIARKFFETDTPSQRLLDAEQKVQEMFESMFINSPHLLSAISQAGVEIKLYDHAYSVFHKGDEAKGLAECGLNKLILSFPVASILSEDDAFMSTWFKREFSLLDNPENYSNSDDAWAPLEHEVGHLLDCLSLINSLEVFSSKNLDGLLPGWDRETIERFKELRRIEKRKIEDGLSGVNLYANEPIKTSNHTIHVMKFALTSNVEFLAELIGAYFEVPEALKESSPELFELVDDFFKNPPQ